VRRLCASLGSKAIRPRRWQLHCRRGLAGGDHRRGPQAVGASVRGRQRRNISVRLDEKHLLCTPTMMSKRDMAPADICLSDLEGVILAGDRMRTSELLLHLEIYKANPKARAIVHCHPPHATAFAMTGSAPPIGLISEYEASIGPAAVAPYETPGTQAFARTVLPFVKDHNTILLANHGIVCWADTVTHAEWLVETFETYCKTYLIAQQIGKPSTSSRTARSRRFWRRSGDWACPMLV